MRDLILTGWRGTEFAKYASHTLPLMDAYATRHGLECYCVNLANEVTHPSWMKVPSIGLTLHDYDRVLWLDADVVIYDSSRNIFDDVDPDAWQSVVEHETECGVVPNCGVWVVTRHMIPSLEFVWDKRLAYENHPWLEQACIMEMMGYKVTAGPHSVMGEPTNLYRRTQFLPAKWNHHPADSRKVDDPAFFHVTQYPDRLTEIRRLCADAT